MLKIKTKVYKKLEYLVTGTGRCGTVFFAHLLTSMGIPCGHEHIFNFEPKKVCFDRLVNPERRINSYVSENSFLDQKFHKNFVDPKKTVAESSYFLVPYLDEHYLTKIPLIHVIRHPFKVIRSFVDDFQYFKNVRETDDPNIEIYENFIYKTYPEIEKFTNPYDKAARYFLSCNKKIILQENKRPYVLIKIEELESKKKELQKFLKKLYPLLIPKHLNSKSTEKTKKIDFSVLSNENLKKELQEFMVKLNYPF